MFTVKNIIKYISYWPPYLASGISVDSYDLDAGYVVSKLKRTPFNGNAFGTHFGGSIFAMCDPWYVFLTLHHLGKGYIVWDIQGEVRFLKATKETIYARFEISQEKIEEIKKQALKGEKVISTYSNEITTKSGEIVAEIKKTTYVRKKP